jgi:hypothetical protein
MKNEKCYVAVAMRKNVDGKLDYIWTYKYANGTPVRFESFAAALEQAKRLCADNAAGLYRPSAKAI